MKRRSARIDGPVPSIAESGSKEDPEYVNRREASDGRRDLGRREPRTGRHGVPEPDRVLATSNGYT